MSELPLCFLRNTTMINLLRCAESPKTLTVFYFNMFMFGDSAQLAAFQRPGKSENTESKKGNRWRISLVHCPRYMFLLNKTKVNIRTNQYLCQSLNIKSSAKVHVLYS